MVTTPRLNMAKIGNRIIYYPPGNIRFEKFSVDITEPDNGDIGPYPCFPHNQPAGNYEIKIDLVSNDGGLVDHPYNGAWVSCDNSFTIVHEMEVPSTTPATTTLVKSAKFNAVVRRKDQHLDTVSGDIFSTLQTYVKNGGVTPPDPDPGDMTPTVFSAASAVANMGGRRPYAGLWLAYSGTNLIIRNQERRNNGVVESEVLGTIGWHNPAYGLPDLENTEILIELVEVFDPVTGAPMESSVSFHLESEFYTPKTMVNNLNDGSTLNILSNWMDWYNFGIADSGTVASHVEFRIFMNLVGQPKGSMFKAAFIFFLDVEKLD